MAQHRYKNLSEEEKQKKRQYHRDQNKNLSEEEKQKKVEYMRNLYLAHKKIFLGSIKYFGHGGFLKAVSKNILRY